MHYRQFGVILAVYPHDLIQVGCDLGDFGFDITVVRFFDVVGQQIEWERLEVDVSALLLVYCLPQFIEELSFVQFFVAVASAMVLFPLQQKSMRYCLKMEAAL